MSTRVLIVEDAENDALLMTRALRQADLGPEVRRVETEPELIGAMEEADWQVVLSDYSLPGFNALGALLLVRQLAPDVPFIVVSGAVGEDVAASLIKSGADDFVLKQNLAQLGSAVHRGLRAAETRRAWRRAERELQEREARFRSIIENVTDVVLILDHRWEVRYQSPSLERVLGFPYQEFIGTNILDYVHPDDIEIARGALTRPAGGPRDFFVPECRMMHRDGSWRIMEGVIADLRDDPAIDGFVIHSRDITRRKRVEEERLRSQRLESIGSLAGGIAHDLNNLLTPILITAEMLESDAYDDEQRGLVDGIRVSAGRAADLVNHLLSFARGMGAGRELLQPAELFDTLGRLLSFSLPKAIHLSIRPAESLWTISGDATQLLQVLMNLSVNARDAMPDGGSLTIEAENVLLREYDVRSNESAQPGPFVHIRVTDTGNGIPWQIRDRIFEPFFTTKEGESGTGLGLPTSLEIVRDHGGLIKVYSEVGSGTRFSIYLPASVTAEKEYTAEPLPRGNGQWILVVDDETSIRELVRETLSAYGYHVETAANGAEALAHYAEFRDRVRLAIVDVAMPLVDGPATVDALRRTEPDLPILVQGGFVDQSRSSFPDDLESFIEKPYTTGTLLRTVARALERSGTRSLRPDESPCRNC